ncbi:hypothetical protein INS49_002313 [Diaporthe citri]|uniref:uncharacterized protein n=1 Tax=Diaporthe citri TaxID=83186 RepID=UPI001C7F0C74|nr:uncharacterized protein INS49_002313 [Diaporthe citri]KAG6368112.1 hypothetical protein INS49_002313 [Diaporthe citri]
MLICGIQYPSFRGFTVAAPGSFLSSEVGVLGRPAMDVAYHYTCPGFRDHCSPLTGVLEFWTAPYPSQCPASATDSDEIRLILLSSNRFELYWVLTAGYHSKPRQSD